MPDYGRSIKFGYFLIPNTDIPLLSIAQEVERLGLDYVAVQDHPYQRRFVDTWTLLSMIAATTSRIGLFPDVANLPLRPPAVMAKAAASIDLLSGGRFELGLGAGGFREAVEAYGARGAPPASRLQPWPRQSRSSERYGAATETCASKASTTTCEGLILGRFLHIPLESGWVYTAHARYG